MSKILQEIEKYQFINTDDSNSIVKLWEGRTGTIYKLKNTTQPLAIKCIKNSNIFNEMSILEQEALDIIGRDSEQVIQQYCMKEITMHDHYLLENNQKYTASVIFMKYYENNLKKQMQTGINMNQFKQIFCNVIGAFSNFYQKLLFFSNLLPENIFLEEIQENQLKCIFSGLIQCHHNKNNAKKQIQLFLKYKYDHYGASQYASPELFLCKNKNFRQYDFDPFSSDIYSAGVILLELLHGSLAIQQLHEAKNQNLIQQYDKILYSLLYCNIIAEEDQEYIQMLESMLQFDNFKRKNALELFENLLDKDLIGKNNYQQNFFDDQLKKQIEIS